MWSFYMFDADWEAYGLTYLVLKELMPLKHMRELDEELLACRDVLKGYDGKSFHFSSNLETDDFIFFGSRFLHTHTHCWELMKSVGSNDN